MKVHFEISQGQSDCWIAEISKVRIALFNFEFAKDQVKLPEPEGEVTITTEKVFVPAKEYPDVGFSLRIKTNGQIPVQLRRSDIGSTRYDREAARARDRMQDHGARQRLDERQEEGGAEQRQAELGAPVRGTSRAYSMRRHAESGQSQADARRRGSQEAASASGKEMVKSSDEMNLHKC